MPVFQPRTLFFEVEMCRMAPDCEKRLLIPWSLYFSAHCKFLGLFFVFFVSFIIWQSKIILIINLITNTCNHFSNSKAHNLKCIQMEFQCLKVTTIQKFVFGKTFFSSYAHLLMLTRLHLFDKKVKCISNLNTTVFLYLSLSFKKKSQSCTEI